MRKIVLMMAVAITMVLAGCGTGVYSVSSGRPDEGAVCFVSTTQYAINVDIDGTQYTTSTIAEKPHKVRRDVKMTADRQIKLSPGRHSVKVSKEGRAIYTREVFVSASEVKIIEL